MKSQAVATCPAVRRSRQLQPEFHFALLAWREIVDRQWRRDPFRRRLLGIDRQGNYYINTKPYPKDQVVTTLAEIFAARTKDKILYLKADNQLRMEKIQEAVDIARKAGVRVLSAVTEQRLGTEPTVSQERAR